MFKHFFMLIYVCFIKLVYMVFRDFFLKSKGELKWIPMQQWSGLMRGNYCN